MTADHEVEERIERLRREIANVERTRRNEIFKRAALLIVTCALTLLALGSAATPFVLVALFGGGALLGSGTLSSLRDTVNAAAELEDVRAVEVLLQARSVPDKPSREIALAGLRRVLPLVGQADRERFPASAVRDLGVLASFGDLELQMAAVRALEFVGNSDSLLIVQQLARHPGMVKDEVRAEAQRIQPLLESRLDAEQKRAMLLRPAEEAGEEMLLRPAQPAHEAPPEALLRPAEADLPEQPLNVMRTGDGGL